MPGKQSRFFYDATLAFVSAANQTQRNCFDNVTLQKYAAKARQKSYVSLEIRQNVWLFAALSHRNSNVTLSNCSALNHKERKEGAKLFTILPWETMGKYATETELKALFAYLQSLPARETGK
jgi:hypothetical protein